MLHLIHTPKGSSHPNENLRFSIRDSVCPGKRLAGIRSLRNHFSDRQVQGGGVRVILKKEAGCPKGEGALSQDVLAQSHGMIYSWMLMQSCLILAQG